MELEDDTDAAVLAPCGATGRSCRHFPTALPCHMHADTRPASADPPMNPAKENETSAKTKEDTGGGNPTVPTATGCVATCAPSAALFFCPLSQSSYSSTSGGGCSKFDRGDGRRGLFCRWFLCPFRVNSCVPVTVPRMWRSGTDEASPPRRDRGRHLARRLFPAAAGHGGRRSIDRPPVAVTAGQTCHRP